MDKDQTTNGKTTKPRKQRLELTWIGKDEEIKIEPRILIEDPEKSYGDPNSENMLIHGDNLLALKALEQEYTGKIKCIYIDPPYNTGSAFEHYDDGVEHSIWLNLMKPRLESLLNLLSENGVIFISIDDNEMPYLRVLCDEIFGRKNNICTLIWQKVYSPKNQSKRISIDHEYILSYAKNENKLDFNLLERTVEMNKRYKNPDNDPRGPWKSGDLIANEERKNGHYIIKGPYGDEFDAPPGKHWAFAQDKMMMLINDNRVYFGKNGRAIPSLKQFLSEVQQGRKATTLLLHNEVGHNDESKKEVIKINAQDVFSTPKPERLVKRLLDLATEEGDIVLDSFLGSGTTSAVAHKMKRKYIGIELGSHVYSHCLPRLKKVVDGKDELPLSETLNWQGGGGFRFYNLAPSLLRKDKYNNWIIDEKYNANMLAAAMCKHEGFKFFPHEELYWKQGQSTETDFIFVTTSFVTVEQLDKIHEEMNESESLLICAKSFSPECKDKYPNITIKKIPQMILGRCEFGKDNYDLNIIQATEEIKESEDYE